MENILSMKEFLKRLSEASGDEGLDLIESFQSGGVEGFSDLILKIDSLEATVDDVKTACYELIEEYEKFPEKIAELVTEQVYIGRVIIGMEVSEYNEKQLLKIKDAISKV